MTQTPTGLTHHRDDSACDLVTVNEVAALLKTSPSWVYKRTYDTAKPAAVHQAARRAEVPAGRRRRMARSAHQDTHHERAAVTIQKSRRRAPHLR